MTVGANSQCAPDRKKKECQGVKRCKNGSEAKGRFPQGTAYKRKSLTKSFGSAKKNPPSGKRIGISGLLDLVVGGPVLYWRKKRGDQIKA